MRIASNIWPAINWGTSSAVKERMMENDRHTGSGAAVRGCRALGRGVSSIIMHVVVVGRTDGDGWRIRGER